MIKIVKNVLTNKERKKLIKDCKPHLIDGKELLTIYGKYYPPGFRFPAQQTKETIYDIPCFKEPINKILVSASRALQKGLGLHQAWITCTTGKDTDCSWHNHPFKWSCVYYMKTIPFIDSGTLFKDGFMRAPQNSLIIFPGNLDHCPPTSPLRFKRYTLALDLGDTP